MVAKATASIFNDSLSPSFLFLLSPFHNSLLKLRRLLRLHLFNPFLISLLDYYLFPFLLLHNLLTLDVLRLLLLLIISRVLLFFRLVLFSLVFGCF
jgi:hypothetical protein